MSLIPDGFGQNADASISNAGPHDSVLLSNTSDALASAGQEQQGQQPGLLKCRQTGKKFVNEEQIHSAEHQIDDYNQNHVYQETQSYSVPEPEIEVYEEQNLVYQELQACSLPNPEIEVNEEQNLVYQETQTYSVPEPEIEVNEEQNLVYQEPQTYSVPEPEIEVSEKQNLVDEEPQAYSVPEPEIEVNEKQNLVYQELQAFSVPQPEIEVNEQQNLVYQELQAFSDLEPEIEEIKIEEFLTPLERTTIAVHKTLLYLGELCKRVAAEPHPEEERVRSQIYEIITLSGKLLYLGPHLIRSPDPRAWALFREIYLNINSVLEPDADDIAEPGNPMGLEVLNRIRKIIFGWYKKDTQADPDEAGSGSGPIGDQHLRSTRKRRIAEDEPPLIKYRRVDNSFPRFIPNEIAEDPVPSISMADREREKGNPRQFAKRLSIFNAPTLIQHRVRNNASNINIDLSDDDEPMPSFGPGASYRPPPPLTGITCMNSDSTSSLAMRPQMLYSDAVRLGQNGFPDSRMNGHPNPIRSSGHGEDSLLNQQDRRSEHEQYLALLRNVCNDKSTIRAINNTKPPPLQLVNRAPERSNTWGSILANNKPPLSRQEQSPPPPKAVSNSANRDFVDYAKLLDREQKKSSPPPLMRLSSSKSITSHASTISISETSSSSNSSNTSDADQTNDNSAKGKAAARQANDTDSTPSKEPLKIDPNSPTLSYLDLQRRFAGCRFFKDDYAEEFKNRLKNQQKEIEHRRQLAIKQAEESREARREFENSMRAKIFQFSLTYKPLLVIGSVDTAKDGKESEFIPLTEEHMKRFNELINGAPHQVIVSKFSLQITKNDIRTLLGSRWLNDEVINFYMNLLTERSELRSSELPSVYAMNTFFVPRLLQNGYGGVKRWTRKVDLFSKDIIPVPVHCNGVHWCMAVIHMRDKSILYYDSMGKPNQDVLDALESYLRQESLDKRKQPFDTSGFRIESVPNVPQQTNGSDCGVFSCMFAEYISRDAPITFSQENMDYFRKKMVLEIADGKLWK